MGRRARTESSETVYSRLSTARVDAGLTRQQLADAIEVHYQTIGYLERGRYSPSLVLALRIAKVLGCPVEQLFSLDPFPESTAGGGVHVTLE